MKVTLFTDGSAIRNPDGPGGYGSILRFVDYKNRIYEKEISKGYQRTTNNRMELMGVIAGLRELTVPCSVTVISDSRYVVDAFNQNWIVKWHKNGWKTASGQPVKNIDLWETLCDLIASHKEVKFSWIKGHAGFPENERCDMLARTAALGDELYEDTAYEKSG